MHKGRISNRLKCTSTQGKLCKRAQVQNGSIAKVQKGRSDEGHKGTSAKEQKCEKVKVQNGKRAKVSNGNSKSPHLSGHGHTDGIVVIVGRAPKGLPFRWVAIQMEFVFP